jgi:superfamily II DNA/RNA helicase
MCSTKSETNWKDMTVPELKSKLKEWKLPVSGKKSELVERLEAHELNHLQPTGSTQLNNDKKRSISFPPPTDDTEVQVMEKEVQETIRILEGLKLGDSSKKVISDVLKVPSEPEEQLTQQQKQQKKLMKELKQSLHESQIQPQEKSNQSASESGSEQMQHYVEQLRLKPANDLKVELSNLRLPTKGRKPDLVDRLAKYYVAQDQGRESGAADDDDDEDMDDDEVQMPTIVAPSSTTLSLDRPMSFAGISRLSTAATNALRQAFTDPKPTPIQKVAIPKLFYAHQSALLHAETGSGKTLTYVLPITESLWKEVEDASNNGDIDPDAMENGISLVLLPTRELAAQVAGIASVLAPKGMVKLVPRPMNLMSLWKAEADRGEEYEYYEKEGNHAEPTNSSGRTYKPRILVGSAKTISLSLFGDKKMPAPPTSKPEGKSLLSNTRWLVMDEVDRLLNVKKSRTDKSFKRHEKPAAMLAAAIARLTKGRVQVIAASATVGRPIRRELSRVLGLHSSECPETLRGEEDTVNMEKKVANDETHIGRAVKIPDTVKNYVLPVDGSTTGSLLTSAAFAAKTILSPPQQGMSSRKVLLVLTRGSDIKVHNALGALRHFGINPEPQSLLDALEGDGTDRLMEAHRKVSRVVGIGGSKDKKKDRLDSDDGYLLITHEDNVRGLHLDGLDAVIVVGRPGSPDEYTHIAGRTGRAGREGSVLNIVSYEQAAALASWTKMLSVDFLPVDESELNSIV